MKPSDKAKYLSILLKLIVILSAAVGIYRTATAGRGSFMGGSRVFMFFTIQSNIAVALICAVGLWLLLRHTPPKTVWYVVQFVGAVSITLTGVVFAFVLAPTEASYPPRHAAAPCLCHLCRHRVSGWMGVFERRSLSLFLPELGKPRRRIRIYPWSSVHGHRLVDSCHLGFSAGDRVRLPGHFGSFEKANISQLFMRSLMQNV